MLAILQNRALRFNPAVVAQTQIQELKYSFLFIRCPVVYRELLQAPQMPCRSLSGERTRPDPHPASAPGGPRDAQEGWSGTDPLASPWTFWAVGLGQNPRPARLP